MLQMVFVCGVRVQCCKLFSPSGTSTQRNANEDCDPVQLCFRQLTSRVSSLSESRDVGIGMLVFEPCLCFLATGGIGRLAHFGGR